MAGGNGRVVLQRKLTRVERIGAERVTRSYQQAPQFAAAVRVDMTRVLQLRRQFAQQQPGASVSPSMTVFLLRAVTLCLARHWHLNARFEPPDIVVFNDRVNLGVAVDTDRGLVVPVIKQADTLALRDLVGVYAALIERARQGRLGLEDLADGTFTVSNLGMLGIEWFHAIINPPQSAILAVGAMIEEPVALDGSIAIRPMLSLVLTSDHRVVDGARAARFLADLKHELEGCDTLSAELAGINEG